MKRQSGKILLGGLFVWLIVGLGPRITHAQVRVSIGVTETLSTYNPYGDSVSLMYGIWCRVYGCLVDYDFERQTYTGILAERWEVQNPNTWVFYLKKNAKWEDGRPVTAADVAHSVTRINNDPQSKQKQNTRPIEKVEIVNDRTFKIITKEPTAPLLEYLAEIIITSKSVYDKYGPEVADREHPVGSGPYKLKQLDVGQRIVLAKNPDYPGMKQKEQTPDEVIFQIMRDTEQRVTALLNDEIQIAQFIPPHLRGRVSKHPGTRVVVADSVEIMLLAMSPKYKPWDNKLLRQAVAYAIDRDKIITAILEGQAVRLDGPIGPGQYGYNPNLKPRYTYDPEKARRLVIQAGFPNGVDVDFYTPVSRYTLDKQIAEAIVPMLHAVGIRARLQTPEWSTLWANVQNGKVPFYYMGRGNVVDPSVFLRQQFQTGESLRVGYSNPDVDKLLAEERRTFDPEKRKNILSQAMSLITEEAPEHFLWLHKFLYGISDRVEFKPTPNGRIFPETIRVSR